MPELPEVENFVRFLAANLVNRKILAVSISYPNLIKKPLNPALFTSQIVNTTFNKITRRGKYLLFFLDSLVLIVHLRMEGKFLISSPDSFQQCSNHCLLEMKLDNHKILHYLDFRKFGTFHLERIDNYLLNKGLTRLGLEPFDPKLTVAFLWKKWKNRHSNIKTALLEQKVIVGIGNIYASEILFATKIWPWTKLSALTKEQLRKIIKHTRIILKKAIELKGSTISTFQIQNQKGLFFDQLKVYGRTGQTCLECGDLIVRKKIIGRSTFFCLQCQKENNS